MPRHRVRRDCRPWRSHRGPPDPGSIPDLTFGLGPPGYEASQTYGAQLETAFLDNVNLAGLIERLGVDPETAINTALGNALLSALTGVTLGWVPGFPKSVADEINRTQYLGISPVALLQALKMQPGVTDADKLIPGSLDPDGQGSLR